ncbi:MAG: glycosyltransferase family 4 protein [Nitrospirota bacterium]|nr:glycosyltransferase family 4 protein [Nitrospirota bacterium]
MSRVLLLGSSSESLSGFRGPLIRELIHRGHEVIACAPDFSADDARALTESGAVCREVPLSRTGTNPIHDLRSLIALVMLFRQVKPDVFLGYMIKPVIYGTLAAWLAQVPTRCAMIEGLGYAFVGEGRTARRAGRVATILYRMALRRVHTVFFLNPEDQSAFVERKILTQPEKAVQIGGIGVDVTRFTPAPLPEGEVVFLLIARLLKSKGIREYAAAATDLRARYPHARFLLVGWDYGGPDGVSEGEVRSWENSGAIEYLGRMRDVRPAIERASVYVLPSYREGFPVTVMEAMAMGRPVVATDVPGCRDAVEEGVTGVLVPPRDVAGLVKGMERFLMDPSLIPKMGRESRRVAEERFDVRKVNALILREMGLS